MDISNSSNEDSNKFDPFEFVNTNPALGVIIFLVLVVASVAGTGGNLLILLAVAKNRDLQNVESVFIVNLAVCDMYVTLVADPLSIVGELTRCCASCFNFCFG